MCLPVTVWKLKVCRSQAVNLQIVTPESFLWEFSQAADGEKKKKITLYVYNEWR